MPVLTRCIEDSSISEVWDSPLVLIKRKDGINICDIYFIG